MSNKQNKARCLPAMVRGVGAVVTIAAVGAALAGCAPSAQAAPERSDPTQLRSLQVAADQVEGAGQPGVQPAVAVAQGEPDPALPVEAPPADPAADPAAEAPGTPSEAPAGEQTSPGDDEPGAPSDDPADDPAVGPAAAPTITFTPGGQGARVLYVAPSWNQPDLGGGELVNYHVVIKDGNGVVLRDETTPNQTVPRYEGDRCLAPYTVSVTAITRAPGTDELVTGTTGTATWGPGCAVSMEINGGLTSPQDIGVQLFRLSGYDPYSTVPCDLLLDGAVIWSGRCGTLQQSGPDGQYIGYGAGFEPNTDHEIVLRIQQFVGGPTYSNTIKLTTPAS